MFKPILSESFDSNNEIILIKFIQRLNPISVNQMVLIKLVPRLNPISVKKILTKILAVVEKLLFILLFFPSAIFPRFFFYNLPSQSLFHNNSRDTIIDFFLFKATLFKKSIFNYLIETFLFHFSKKKKSV